MLSIERLRSPRWPQDIGIFNLRGIRNIGGYAFYLLN